MHVAYARTELPKSIFLAGPTPRAAHVKSWRPEALAILQSLSFDGTVFVPEDGDGSWKFSYDDQVEWELQALNSATAIVFWIPREMSDMPALTTNIEFGMFCNRPNIVIGYPPGAERMKYINAIGTMYKRTIYSTLQSTLIEALRITNRPFPTS